ncbi:hypothetical protein [Actinomadura sp. NBRC 104425]|uniref:hypothetical protein n=1 Tax=Actinomadura sp. NBRC 104425 TaxID=3032204 RepID=UPI0025543586|nr:hypothetical protein [Actinomadura sp. NBRC 104425]
MDTEEISTAGIRHRNGRPTASSAQLTQVIGVNLGPLRSHCTGRDFPLHALDRRAAADERGWA